MQTARDDDGASGWTASDFPPAASAVFDALPWITLAVSPSSHVLAANAAWRHAAVEGGPAGAALAHPVGALLSDLAAPGEADRWLPHLADLICRKTERVVDSLRFAWQDSASAYLAVATRATVGSARCTVLCCTDVGPESDVARYRAHQEAPLHDLLRRIANRLTHRINNPLFVITATLEDLLAETDDPHQRARLQGALDAAWKVGESVLGLVELRDMLTDPRLHSRPVEELERLLREP